MVEHKIFAIYDSKAGAYLPPWTSTNAATAARRFEASLESKESDFARFPADYTLFQIGSWDEEFGVMEMDQAPTNLGTALSYIKDDTNA